VSSGADPTMSDPAPERISVKTDFTADEYARYAAAIDRANRSWTSVYVFAAVLFSGIPVALLLRSIAAQRLGDSDALEMLGDYSLYAFGIAIFINWIGTSVHRWIVRRRYFRTEVNTPEPRTTELDHNGVTVNGDGARVTYDWAVVSRWTVKQKLLLMWVAPAVAVVIPTRCFGDEAASAAALAFIQARITEAKAKLAEAAASSSPKPDAGPA
jgi:hypothetical protein